MSSVFLALSQSMPGSKAKAEKRRSTQQTDLEDGKDVKKVDARTRFFSRSITAHTFWSSLLTIVALIVSIVLGFSWKLPEVQAVVPLDASDDIPQISVAIDFLSVDPTGGTMVTDWYLFHSDCDRPEIVANIFFDSNLITTDQSSDDIPSQDPPSKPTFSFNTTKRCQPTLRDNLATFRITSKVLGNGGGDFGEKSSVQNYPFDTYYSQISLFALTQNGNQSVGIQVAKTYGVPVNVGVNLNTVLSVNTAEGLYIVLNVNRASSVKALVLIIFLGNWFITLSFIWIVSAALIWSAETVKELFAIPIATLFAFTAVRANLPGAPPSFGAFLDFVGILPNIALMTLTSAILIMAMLWRRVVESLYERRKLESTKLTIPEKVEKIENVESPSS